MFRRIRDIIEKKKAIKERSEACAQVLGGYVKEVCELLNIESLGIICVDAIFEAFNPKMGENMVHVMPKLYEDEIPEDAGINGGFYSDDMNTIYLSIMYPVTDEETGDRSFKKMTYGEILFHLVHELRHVWQRRYAAEKYYKTNAVGLEHIEDIAEADADAFALAYVFSGKTRYDYNDFPLTAEEIVLHTAADDGARWKRVRELAKEYGFDCEQKAKALKTSVDPDKIEAYVKLTKAFQRYQVIV